MKRVFGFLTASALALVASVQAQAQYPYQGVNPMYPNGNGAHNMIRAANHAPLSSLALRGMSRNHIHNSGNGIGNAIVAANQSGIMPGAGYFPYGGPPGVNVNVITNSANGVGNQILAGNQGPGWLNINVITNSGNGIGNFIGTQNGP